MVRDLDHIKKKSNKPLFIITAAVCFVLFTFAIFNFTFNYFMNKSNSNYENAIVKYLNNINSTNLSVISLIKGQTIDTDAAKKSLPAKIDQLIKDKDALQQLQPIDSYKKVHQSLIAGLQNNINVYRQINAILVSPQSPDLESSSANIEKYKNDCMNYYSLTVFKTAQIVLPGKCLTFINNSIGYVNELIRIKKAIEIKVSQNSDFDTNVDTILNEFQPLMIDFNVYAIKARNGLGKYDDILNMIDSTKLSFNNVTNDFSKLTVPPEAIPIYNSLNSTFTNFDLYLNNFRYALTNEQNKANGVALDKNSIDSLYSIPLKNFADMYTNYNGFVKLYEDFKNSK
jgi:hypothetical protein